MDKERCAYSSFLLPDEYGQVVFEELQATQYLEKITNIPAADCAVQQYEGFIELVESGAISGDPLFVIIKNYEETLELIKVIEGKKSKQSSRNASYWARRFSEKISNRSNLF